MVFKGTKLQLRAVREINPEEEVRDDRVLTTLWNMTRYIDCDVATAFYDRLLYEQYVLNVCLFAVVIDEGADA